jgi:nicotinamide-nucleotide amidase
VSVDDTQVIASGLRHLGQSLAVAESLTCGALASALGKGAEASAWFAGGVVAYFSDVKFRLLGVDEGPVITASCARQMALGVRRLLHSDVALAITGVGGPDPEEGKPPGTVFVATHVNDRVRVHEHAFAGDTDDILSQTIAAALNQAGREIREAGRRSVAQRSKPGRT